MQNIHPIKIAYLIQDLKSSGIKKKNCLSCSRLKIIWKLAQLRVKMKHKTYTNIKHKIFEELVPSGLPLLKKHIRLGHTGIVDYSIDLCIPDFFKCLKKI